MKILNLFFTFSYALDELLMLLMFQNQDLGPSQDQQISQMLPLLLLSDDFGSSDNSNLLMMMLMQENGHVSNFNAILPMLLIGDDDFSGDIDFKTLFLLSSMTQKDCSVSTAGQLNNLLPLLLMASDSNNNNSTDPLMLMLMMQTMGGQGTVQMDTLLPFMLSSDSGAENDNLMLMIMMSAMSGGLNSQQGKYFHN